MSYPILLDPILFLPPTQDAIVTTSIIAFWVGNPYKLLLDPMCLPKMAKNNFNLTQPPRGNTWKTGASVCEVRRFDTTGPRLGSSGMSMDKMTSPL